MTVTIYKSTDTSAPTLQGIVGGALTGHDWADGSLLQLLRKCLVTGYGSQAAAGWSQPFDGTSEGVFQAGGGNQRLLHVLDDGSATAGAREAKMTGFGAMSALATGTDQFPAAGQNGGVLFWRKSDTADTTVRSWIVFADDRTFYFFAYTGFTTAYYAGGMFGDFASVISGDVWNTCIIGRVTSAIADAATNETLDQLNLTGAGMAGHYLPRGYAQLGTSLQFGVEALPFPSNTTNTRFGLGTLPYPNTDGLMYLSRCYITDPSTLPTTSLRGHLRGFWSVQNQGGVVPFEYTVQGTGGLTGRTLRVLGLQGSGATSRYVLETSSTWD